MNPKQIKQKVDLNGGITLLPKKVTTDEGKELRYIEGELKKNKVGRYEIDEKHGLFDGCVVELLLCGTWIKTVITISGNKYFAEGLKGLPLVGVYARIYE